MQFYVSIGLGPGAHLVFNLTAPPGANFISSRFALGNGHLKYMCVQCTCIDARGFYVTVNRENKQRAESTFAFCGARPR